MKYIYDKTTAEIKLIFILMAKCSYVLLTQLEVQPAPRGKKQSHKTNDPAKKERKKNLKYTNIFMIIFPNNNVEKMHIKHKHQNMAHCCCGMWNRQRLTIQILFKASKSNTEFYSNSYTYLPISRPRCLSFRLDECFSLLWTLCCARMYFMVHILYSRRYRLVSHIIDGIFTFSAILPMSNRIEILFTLDRPFQAYEQISRCAYCESHEKRWTHSFRYSLRVEREGERVSTKFMNCLMSMEMMHEHFTWPITGWPKRLAFKRDGQNM